MTKQTLFNKIIYLLLIVIYISYVILGFHDAVFDGFNVYRHLFEVPFLKFLKVINMAFDFRLCYFIVFMLGFYIIVPINKMFFGQIKAAIDFYHNIVEIKKKEDIDTQVRANEMIDALEATNFSFIKLFVLLYFELLFTGFIMCILSSAFNTEIFNILSFKVLWFNLNSRDLGLFIVTIVLIIISLSLIFTRKIDKNEKIFISLIAIGGSCFLIPAIYYSVAFALFMISSYTMTFLKLFYKGVKSRYEKSIEQNRNL